MSVIDKIAEALQLRPAQRAIEYRGRWYDWLAMAEVRVNRGSMWMIVAPRALASITHWKPTG